MTLRHAWLAALCLAASQSAGARPYAVEDLLALEGYGKAVFAPDGSWAAIEKLRPYASGHRFAYDSMTSRILRRVMRVDLSGRGALTPLFAQDEDAGYWMGTPSPSGQKLTVFRLQGSELSLGIADPEHRTVDWLEGVPATPLFNPHPVWIDDTRILALALVGTSPGFPLDIGMRLQNRLPQKWEQTAEGKVAGVSVLSSENAQLGPTAELVSIDLASGTRHKLMRARIVDLALSADRKWAALTVETGFARPDPERAVIPSDQPVSFGIRIVELATGKVRQVCEHCETNPSLLSWSPDGARLLYFERAPGDPWLKGSLRIYDALTDRSQLAAPPGLVPWMPYAKMGSPVVTAGWLGEGAAILGSDNGDGKPKWFDAKGPISPLSSSGCTTTRIAVVQNASFFICGDKVEVIDPAAGRPLLTVPSPSLAKPYADTFDVGIRIKYDPVVRAQTVAIASGGKRPRAWWVDGRKIGAPMKLPDNVDRFLGGPPNGPLLSLTRDAHGIGGLWLSSADHPARMIDAINLHLAGIDWPRLQRIDGPGGDSDWLVLPPGSKPGDKLPLVIIPYPSTKFGTTVPRFLAPDRDGVVVNVQLLAGAGYAVLLPSMADRQDRTNPIDGMGAEVEAAADRAIATGRIDPQRMAVWGHSYGGYTTVAVAEQSRKFAAYIASAPLLNPFNSYGEFMPFDRVSLEGGLDQSMAFGWYESGQGGLGGPPWRDPQRYVQNTPLLHLDKIEQPLMLLQGDVDYASVGGSERLYAGLYRIGRDVTLIRYWGEGHEIRSPANTRDVFDRIKIWLAEKLGPVSSSAQPKARAK